MPQYATQADLAQVGLKAELTSGIASADLDAVLLKRSVFADSFLGRRYALPIITWGDDLRLAVAQLAAWDIVTALIGFNPNEPSGEIWKDRRDEALQWLRDVVALKVDPAIEDSTPSVTNDGAVMPEIYTSSPRGW